MTEAEWLASTDPLKLLDYRPRKTDTRRLRLLACAFARHVWHLLGDPRSRDAVKVAEDYADGEAFSEQLHVWPTWFTVAEEQQATALLASDLELLGVPRVLVRWWLAP